MPETTKKNDFIEIRFTGYANGEIFDSNVEEDLKKLHEKAEPQKLIVIIGQGMVVPGLDKALENKELEKEYEVSFSAKEGFGERKRNLIQVIPLKSFTEQKVSPVPGMVFTLNNNLVKIIAVSGARVTADFNNPLAGKELRYKFKIIRKVSDAKEKSETLFKLFFQFVPEFEIKENKTIVKLPKGLESLIENVKQKFKDLSGQDLVFEELKKPEKKESSPTPEDKNIQNHSDNL